MAAHSNLPKFFSFLLQMLAASIRLTHQQDNGSPYLTSADFPAPTTRYNQTSELLNRLLEDYDIRLRPNFGGKSLDLKMDVLIASFDEISEVNMDYTITMYLHQYWDHSIFHTFQDYTITMYLHQYWSDDRLAWSSTRNESMTLSGDFADRIWVPDTFLANDKKSFLHDVTETNKMLRLHSDGFLVYGMRFTTTLACNMNLRYYPLDSQECTVEIESYGYTTEDIMMYWKDNRSSVKGVKRAKIAQFTILGFDTQSKVETTATDGEMYYISGWEVHDTVTHRLGGSYQRISLRFHLQRNIGYFIFQTYLPSILIVMLSWVSFWINHEATSARVALGITTVLTMTTISTGVRATLPRISYIKAIDIYLVMSFVFVFAALLEYAAVNYSYWGSRAKRKNKHKEKPKEYDENKWGSFSEDDDEQGPSATSSLQTTMMPVQQQDNTTRMSPIPSLRAGGPHEDNDQTARPLYPPRARNPIYSTSGRLRYRGGSVKGHNANTAGVENSARRRNRAILNAMRSKARAVKINIPRIKNINLIDKYSRIVFPACFAAFNLFYWLYYTFTTPSPDN